MNRDTLLTIDGLVNLALGFLLVLFPASIVAMMGIPDAQPSFYANILGAVLFGIGIALLLERFGTGSMSRGLGIPGAIAINLCGALVLAWCSIRGGLELPVRGYIFLWGLLAVILVISAFELLASRKPDGA